MRGCGLPGAGVSKLMARRPRSPVPALLGCALLAAPVDARPTALATRAPSLGHALGANVTRPAPETFAWLDAAVADVVARHGVPGVAAALVDRQGTVHELALGLADRDRGRAMTPTTPFRVLSISKSLLAAGALQLAAEGRLDLGARVRDLAPGVGIQNPWAATHPLRVIHLLEHSSGLDDFGFHEIQARGRDGDLPLADLLARSFAPRRVRWPPGTRQAYGNPGYALLAHLVERAAGEGYAAYLERTLFRPAGMDTAGFGNPTPARLAEGYPRSTGPPVPYRPVYFHPAAGATLSARDLARFTRLLLGRGLLDGRRVLAREAVLRMEVRETGPPVPPDAGIGFAKGLYPRGHRVVPTLGHYGGGHAFQATFRYSPELGRGYVLLQNCSDRDRAFEELQRLLVTAMTRDLPERAEPPAVPSPGPEDLAGDYVHASPRHELLRLADRMRHTRRVTRGPGGLLLARGRRAPVPLVAVAAGAFREPDHSAPGVAFVRGAGGELLLLDGRDTFARVEVPWHRALGDLVLTALLLALLAGPTGLWTWLQGRLLELRPEPGPVVVIDDAPARAGAALLAGATGALLAAGLGLWAIPVHGYGEPGTAALLVHAATLLYPVLAWGALGVTAATWMRALRRPGHALRFLLALGHGVLAAMLTAAGLLPLRTF